MSRHPKAGGEAPRGLRSRRDARAEWPASGAVLAVAGDALPACEALSRPGPVRRLQSALIASSNHRPIARRPSGSGGVDLLSVYAELFKCLPRTGGVKLALPG